MRILNKMLIVLRESFLSIFVDGYDEEMERRKLVEEFNKYDCICDANKKGGMNLNGLCHRHDIEW